MPQFSQNSLFFQMGRAGRGRSHVGGRGSSSGAGVGLGPATGGRGMGRRQPSDAGCKEVTASWLCAFRELCQGSAYTQWPPSL